MTHPIPEWAYVVDHTGRNWYHLTKGQKKPLGEKGATPPSKALFAIATNDVISLPQWVSSKENEIIDEVVSTEVERLGIRRDDGPGKTSAWNKVELNGSRTLVQSVSIPWAFPELESMDDVFTTFVPQYALYQPPADSVVLWTEGSIWVAGYSRGEQWVHVQSLGNGTPQSITSEIQLTLLELSAKGIIDSLRQVVVWSELDVDLLRALEEGTSQSVTFETRPLPRLHSMVWDFEPHFVSENRHAEAKKKRGFSIATGSLLLLTLLIGAAFFHLWTLEQSNNRLQRRVIENRDAASEIQSSIDRWYALAPAVDPKRSPLEVYHQISVLLPDEGFRLTSFEIQNNTTVIVRGEGATMANALKVIGAIEGASELADYIWEIAPPTTKGGLAEVVATGTYQLAGNEEE